MSSPSDNGRVGPGLLTSYGLIGLPLAVATLPLYIHIPNFYVVDLGLGLAAVGIVMFAMRLWDVFTDPLIGILSDKTSPRLGRRRLWVAMGIPVAMAGAWAIFSPPQNAGIPYLLFAGMMLHLGWTMVMLPYQAWGAELSADYHTRSRIAAAREVFVIIGTVVAGGLIAAAASQDARTDALRLVGLILVVGLPIAGLPLLLRVPDRPPPVQRTRMHWRQGLKVIAANAPFRRLLLSWVLNGTANGLPATLFLLFVGEIISAPDQSEYFLLAYFSMSVAGMPLWLWLARRHGKHRVWCGAMIWGCGWFALAPFLGPGDTVLYGALCLGTGLALGADLALPASMQADVVDVDTAEAGQSRAGIYFALWGMATKLSLALAVGIAFPLLDVAGFDPDTGGETGTWVLVMLYGVVPIVFKLAAIAVMWRFPLTASAQAALRNKIAGGQVT